jgi:hypothetical protein
VSKLGSSMEQSRWQTLSPADFSLSAGLVRDHGALPLVREKRLFPRGNAAGRGRTLGVYAKARAVGLRASIIEEVWSFRGRPPYIEALPEITPGSSRTAPDKLSRYRGASKRPAAKAAPHFRAPDGLGPPSCRPAQVACAQRTDATTQRFGKAGPIARR